jgi:hypothetical protein
MSFPRAGLCVRVSEGCLQIPGSGDAHPPWPHPPWDRPPTCRAIFELRVGVTVGVFGEERRGAGDLPIKFKLLGMAPGNLPQARCLGRPLVAALLPDCSTPVARPLEGRPYEVASP